MAIRYTGQDVPKNNMNRNIFIGLIILLVISGIFFIYLKYFNTKNSGDETVMATDGQEVADYFKLTEYDYVDECYKTIIFNFMKTNYPYGVYFLTKNPSRAKKVIALGNFSNSKSTDATNCADKDIALIVEENDFTDSKLFIISKKGDVLYTKDFSNELPTIKYFKKGSKIYIEQPELVKSPSDGIILQFKNYKQALILDSVTNTYEIYQQYSEEDIKNLLSPEDEGDSYSEPETQPNVIIDTTRRD